METRELPAGMQVSSEVVRFVYSEAKLRILRSGCEVRVRARVKARVDTKEKLTCVRRVLPKRKHGHAVDTHEFNTNLDGALHEFRRVPRTSEENAASRNAGM